MTQILEFNTKQKREFAKQKDNKIIMALQLLWNIATFILRLT